MTGTILVSDEGGAGSFQDLADAREIAAAVALAVEDGVDGIIIRVDSPGGSAVASAIIAEAIDEAMTADVPVVVSMGGAAASGGYWIAAGASEIVAQPATLTGSIGVFAGGLSTDAFWTRLGVNWEAIDRGANAGFWSPVRPYGETGQQRLAAIVDALYGQFIDRVAAGRGLEREAVLAVAEGRVWTGRQAAEHGLVDRLGGLDVAQAALREQLELAADARLTLAIYPQDRDLLETLTDLLSRGSVGAGTSQIERLLTNSGAAPLVEALLVRPGDRLLQSPFLASVR